LRFISWMNFIPFSFWCGGKKIIGGR
jgi:hypothetical protein